MVQRTRGWGLLLLGTLLSAGGAVAADPAPKPAKEAQSSAHGAAAHLNLDDPRVLELISQGASSAEAAKVRGPRVDSPQQALVELRKGNARFFTGTAKRPELAANQRRAQILTQTPFAAVLSCADSRVPTELVYDQGLGDIFTTRNAGNVVEPASLGSLQYAVNHLKPRIVVVMGHEGCGAVSAALLPESQRNKEPEQVRYLLDQIAPAVAKLPAIRDTKARSREAVIANVRLQVQELKKDPVIAEAVRQKRILVVGAFYEITSGAVDFLETPEELRVD